MSPDPLKFIRFGAMDVTRPYTFKWMSTEPIISKNIWAMDVTRPYKFKKGLGRALGVPRPYKIIGLGNPDPAGNFCALISIHEGTETPP